MSLQGEGLNPKVQAANGRGFFDSNLWLQAGVVLVLLGFGLGLRLINLTNPPLDYHPDRQLHSAIIARGMYCQLVACGDDGFRRTAIALWEGETVYEPQILERLVSFVYILIGHEYLWVIRVLNAFFWLVGGAALFLLASRMTSADGAIAALTVYSILDFFILLNRAFLPETFMLMWVLLATLALYHWVESGTWKWAFAAGFLSGIAILVKVVAVFPLTCSGLLLVLLKDRFSLRRIVKDPQVWFVGFWMVFIPALYYLFSIGQRSAGFFEFWTLSFLRLLIQPSFYAGWLSFIHGLVGLTLLMLGISGSLNLPALGRMVVWGWGIGYVLYGLFLPHQVTTHDYYNIFLVPLLALSVAGLAQIFFMMLKTQSLFSQICVLGIALFGIVFSTWQTRCSIMADDMRQETTAWRRMGEELPADGEIVALTQDYGNRLRYYGNRSFILWPYSWDFDLTLRRGGNVGSFEELFDRYTGDAKYFMVSYFSELDVQSELKSELYEHYPIVQQGDGYILFDLSQRFLPSP